MVNQNETWKDLINYEGLYQASNRGRIRSTKTLRILKQNLNKNNGYMQITLHKDGYCKTHSVHRLIAMTFIKNPNNLPQINHKNEIKTDNDVCNMEWCDNKYNCNYGTKTESVKKKTNQYTVRGEFIKTWNSLTEIQDKLGFRKSNLSSCCNGKLPTAYGFVWRYV